MAVIRSIVWALAVFVTAGCGSSPSRVTHSEVTYSEPPAQTELSGGRLFGHFYLDGAINADFPIDVFLSEDLQFRVLQPHAYFEPKTYLLLRGSFSVDGAQFEGSGTAIAAPGETWSDGESVTGFSIYGSLFRPTTTSDGRLLVAVSMDSGDTGRIDAKFNINGSYWNPSDLAMLAGDWLAQENENGSWHPESASFFPDPSTMTVAAIGVSSDGHFSGTEDLGCSLDGQFALIDTRFGLWNVDYEISECDRSGNYSGLALWGDTEDWWGRSSLYVTADDGTHSQALEFWLSSP